MANARALLMVASLAVTIAGPAVGQSLSNDHSLHLQTMTITGTALGSQAVSQASYTPPVYLSLRGGAMLSPRGAALVGLDASVPQISMLNGMRGRLDADVIIKANFAGVNTIVPVTLDQISYVNNPTGIAKTYYGFGVGAIMGGKTRFDGKLILGTEITSHLGAELNIHLNSEDTLCVVAARLHI